MFALWGVSWSGDARGLEINPLQISEVKMNSLHISEALYSVNPFIMLAFWAVSWPGDAARIGKWILRKPQNGK